MMLDISFKGVAQAAFLLLTSTSVAAQYTLQDDYSSASFASMVNFFTDNDPTAGYVNYVSQSQAPSQGLFSNDNGTIYLGVDSTNAASGWGRGSVRVSTKKSYSHGLIILHLAHMPASPNWPDSGEIDIVEGVNTQETTQMTARTSSGCAISSSRNFAAMLATANCDVNAPDQATNAGCSIQTGNTQAYGSGFNAGGGGVYATEWTSEAISIWFLPRSAIPADIQNGSPNPANWSLPLAQFKGGCDIEKHFMNQQIVFDITFGGQWAGQVWNTDAVCSSFAPTCQDYVQNNPSAFFDTYWNINSLKVSQDSVEENYPSLATSASLLTSSVTPWITKTLDASTTLSTVVASVSTTSYDIPSSTSEPTSGATVHIPTTYPPSSARSTQSAKDRTGSWWI